MKPVTQAGQRDRAHFGSWAIFMTVGLLLAFATIISSGTAAAAAYVDAGTPDVRTEDRVVIAHPQPVQLLFQFQTKGAPNAAGTKVLKQEVIDTVKASGLFSEVDETPTANGAILSIVIDDVADPKDMQDAEGKGFLTGATFFVAGSNIYDHYTSTIDYIASPAAPKITRTAKHAIIFQMGLINSPPPGAVKIGSLKDAEMTMTRQIVANPLNALASDPGFQAAAATTDPIAQTVGSPARPGQTAVPEPSQASPPSTVAASAAAPALVPAAASTQAQP